MKPVYLNTDLELRARFDLTPLHDELDRLGLVHGSLETRHGVWVVRYNCDLPHAHPADAINRMLDLVDLLSVEGKAMWKSCVARRFDIGYDYSNEPFGWSHGAWQLHPKLLLRLGEMDASIVITIYRLDMKRE